MKDFELKNTAPEDIEDLLVKVEKSFGIKFISNELTHVQTFGEMCDLIKSKIRLENADNCTTQQAFYKLRNSIINNLQVDKEQLTPDTSLADFLPRRTRKTAIKRIEQDLEFKLSILRPPHFITGFLTLLLLAAFVGLFFNWQFGLSGLVLAIGGLWVANKKGNELDLKTIGQLAVKMTRENYLNSRRNPNSYNDLEIEKILTGWFSDDLAIDKSNLNREARLN
ncbi:hypothetical protein GU926_17665 [Nibribacter ruber]|uniref:Uncharacterized protein n=1 Tax=Nibribacter ruber TaxID=2698458 RepID=A0A6P1P472_9BACT|nr:hypothetical protein [Nibribacter ruber]QHL89155.1 hypothetical protein GU926_17640 [Nibribacter ruber]QHL89160.1 hypothetical protein GU926_17665 [Nibribacter ruber]